MTKEDIAKHWNRIKVHGAAVMQNAIPVVQSGLCLGAHYTGEAAAKLAAAADKAVEKLNAERGEVKS